MAKKDKPTETSSFGTRGRISHDSSRFYESKLYQDRQPPTKVEYLETELPADQRNRLYCKSSEAMTELPDNSIQLMVTSPPYNVQKEYDDDLTLDQYLAMLAAVMAETERVLVTGGRACINVANLGRKPYLPLHLYLTRIMLDLGFFMRGEIIWDKGASASPSTAWGTWMSATNPVLRDVHEYILVFSKRSLSRNSDDRQSTIERDDFLELTKSVWTFPPASARAVGHPAPFPEELPRRLIQLYSYAGDVVLDPFCGAGTTCLAALNHGRDYIGYDTEQEYIQLAEERIQAASSQSD